MGVASLTEVTTLAFSSSFAAAQKEIVFTYLKPDILLYA
jgi:hypothetical protein